MLEQAEIQGPRFPEGYGWDVGGDWDPRLNKKGGRERGPRHPEGRTHVGLRTLLGRAHRGAVPGHTARGHCASGTGARRRLLQQGARSVRGRRSATPMGQHAARHGPTDPQLPGVCGRPHVLAGSRRVLRREWRALGLRESPSFLI